MRRLTFGLLSLVLLGLLAAGPLHAQDEDPGFTAAEKSAEGLQEALLMTTSKLVQIEGGQTSKLIFSGTFGESSWQATLSGGHGSGAVALTFEGSFDAASDTGAFTVSGTHGEMSWNGSGTYRFEPVDASTINMFWDSEALIWDPWWQRWLKPDKHFTTPKRWARSRLPNGDVHVVDSGEYRTTWFGIPIGPKKKEISDWIYPGGGGIAVAAVNVQLPDDGIGLVASADFTSGTFNGTLNVVPVADEEPIPSDDEPLPTGDEDLPPGEEPPSDRFPN